MRYIEYGSGATICKCTILFSLFFDVSIQKNSAEAVSPDRFFLACNNLLLWERN